MMRRSVADLFCRPPARLASRGTTKKVCHKTLIIYVCPPVTSRFEKKTFSNIDFFLRLLPLKVDTLLMSEI